jgi:hypothetical protein
MMTQIHQISKEAKLIKKEWSNSDAARYLRILGEGMTYTINDNSPLACIGEPEKNVDWTIQGLQNIDVHQEKVKENESRVIESLGSITFSKNYLWFYLRILQILLS